ncbi:hypothetical protein CUMW_031210 [Citrus unshiu]|nr:hypothetical protein CUMW_031210 [Citrus unshiu]
MQKNSIYTCSRTVALNHFIVHNAWHQVRDSEEEDGFTHWSRSTLPQTQGDGFAMLKLKKPMSFWNLFSASAAEMQSAICRG